MLGKKFRLFFGALGASVCILSSCGKDEGEKPSNTCKNQPTGKIFSEVPNLDFEEWYKGMGGKFDDPSPSDFWATPNLGSVANLGSLANAPVTVFKVSGAGEVYSGEYAVKLVTGESTIASKKYITAGSVASGKFEVKLGSIEEMLKSMVFGQRFDKRPKTVSGYYKYLPVEGDSASVYCFVTKLNSNCKLDTIGFGRQIFYTQQDTYKRFEFDLAYTSNETPDNIIIYLSSSEAGDEFKGRVGNTLYIDAMDIIYHD